MSSGYLPPEATTLYGEFLDSCPSEEVARMLADTRNVVPESYRKTTVVDNEEWVAYIRPDLEMLCPNCVVLVPGGAVPLRAHRPRLHRCRLPMGVRWRAARPPYLPLEKVGTPMVLPIFSPGAVMASLPSSKAIWPPTATRSLDGTCRWGAWRQGTPSTSWLRANVDMLTQHVYRGEVTREVASEWLADIELLASNEDRGISEHDLAISQTMGAAQNRLGRHLCAGQTRILMTERANTAVTMQ